MRIVVTPDGQVLVDGEARQVALALPAGARAMHSDGQVAYREGPRGLVPVHPSDLQPWIDAWTAAAPPPPPAPSVLLPLAFFDRFTAAERAAMRAAAAASAELADWLDSARLAREIDLAAPRTLAGLDALVAAGLLTRARRQAIATAPVAAGERA